MLLIPCPYLLVNRFSHFELDAIINSISKGLDLQYAICAALTDRVIDVKGTNHAEKVWDNILNFAKNFPQKELGVMLVSDMQRVIDGDIFTISEFSDWANKIADVMFD